MSHSNCIHIATHVLLASFAVGQLSSSRAEETLRPRLKILNQAEQLNLKRQQEQFEQQLEPLSSSERRQLKQQLRQQRNKQRFLQQQQLREAQATSRRSRLGDLGNLSTRENIQLQKSKRQQQYQQLDFKLQRKARQLQWRSTVDQVPRLRDSSRTRR